MDEEFFNPRRLYRLFRPRQGVRGTKTTVVPTNRATIALYNNSSGPQVLVVRDFIAFGTANSVIATSYVNAAVGATPGVVDSMVTGDPLPPGQMLSGDFLTNYPADYAFELASTGIFQWWHDYPFGVITPGWSLVFQCTTSAQAISISAIWEAIEIDQLDYFY